MPEPTSNTTPAKLNSTSSSTTTTTKANTTYTRLLHTLLSHPHTFYSPPTSPHAPLLPATESSQIALLSLHPAIESTLHILNQDLPSAHFLLRHAQAGPAWESMYLHGILHRIEGDVDNTRAWYGDVEGQEGFRSVWGEGGEGGMGEGGWKGFLDRVERWRDRTARRDGAKKDGGHGIDWNREEDELNEISLWEIKRVLDFCERKFGMERVEDAMGEYTMLGEKNGDIAANMITGGEGWREF